MLLTFPAPNCLYACVRARPSFRPRFVRSVTNESRLTFSCSLPCRSPSSLLLRSRSCWSDDCCTCAACRREDSSASFSLTERIRRSFSACRAVIELFMCSDVWKREGALREARRGRWPRVTVWKCATCLEPPNTLRRTVETKWWRIRCTSRSLLLRGRRTHHLAALQGRLDAHGFGHLLLQLPPQLLHLKLLLLQLQRQGNSIDRKTPTTQDIHVFTSKATHHQPSCQTPVLSDRSQTTAGIWSSPPPPGSAGSLTASSQCLHSDGTSIHLLLPHTHTQKLHL